ncbi:hypothetical protein MA16_Dca018187 [Dendrobium catenatum]|uniref:C2H2-type domain-containing protein n=1 Tax=Dendrobium catenatum TaxID=906689 RepID=A0A2I0VSU9_9ASPA|nr:hypothetical protein MA16_Dca018187 [Dendrobium catenatum]
MFIFTSPTHILRHSAIPLPPSFSCSLYKWVREEDFCASHAKKNETRRFSSKEGLKEHNKKLHKKLKYTCVDCANQFKTKCELEAHVLEQREAQREAKREEAQRRKHTD